MKKVKSWLSILLVICLCLTMVSVQTSAATTIYWPLSTAYKITNPFSNHGAKDGVDMATSGKAPEVYAVGSGTAYYYQVQATVGGTNYLVSYGNLVELKWGSYVAIYAHLSSFNGVNTPIPSSQTKKYSYSQCKKNGYAYSKKLVGTKNVSEGDVLGNVGTTGNSTGYHLHFGLKVNGSHVNPASYLSQSMTAREHAGGSGGSSGSGSSSSGNHTSNSSYSGFIPFKSYAVNTGNISVYNADGTKYSNRYITGSSDLCTINAVYTDGWCQVTYPSSAEASGYFTAYTKLSEFIPNALPSVATATSDGTAYRRSSGSDSIGSISSGDRCLKVSSGNGRIQAIYPVNGQSYSKAGWVAQSVFGSGNSGGSSSTPASGYKLPCKAYARSSGKVTVYNASHAAYSTSSHYIDGASDLCTINSIGTDGWCQVSYPTSSGSFTAYVPLSTFIPGSASVQGWTANGKYTAYRRSGGSETIGSVSSGDACVKVASENGRTQVMYPVSGQGYYKMGWIDGDTGHNPKGVIDSASGGIYSVTVNGWAYDEDNTGAALGIHVYIGDTCVGGGTADLERTDVHKAYGCGNYHGYSINLNLDRKFAGEQTVRVYAINVGGGTNAYLGEKKVTIGSDTAAPVISDCKVTNVTSSGYTVSCKVTDNTGVDRVQFPTWTNYQGQDDIFASWQTNPAASGKKNGDIYTYQVHISAHNYESGQYITHIYAYDKYGNASSSGVSAVVPIDVEDIVLDKESISFGTIGEEQTLKASVYPEGATNKTIKWTSKNTAVATVKDGVVKAVGAGETKIIATASSGVTAECTVKVSEKKLMGITIASKPKKLEYYVGDSLDTKGLVIQGTYSDGSSQRFESGFACTPNVLNTAGTQKITVSYENKTTTFSVTVKEVPTGKISVENKSGAPGETVKVAVKMEENPGIIAARIKVKYNTDVLTLTKVEDGGILGEHTFGNNLKANPYTMLWENGTVSDNYTKNGTLVYLTFQVAEAASEGKYEVTLSYDPEEIYNVDLKNVKFTANNGKITVKQSAVQQGTCGTNVKWTLDNKDTLTISGTGAMKNYTYKSEMPWYQYINQIQSVKIEKGVTSIGDYAFYGMTALKQIEIPDGIKTIGAYSFKNCTGLKEAELPSTLTKLGESAFYGCSSLSQINIPEGVYTVWAYTFKNCTNLAKVTLPSTLIKLDEAAFYGCASLEQLKIPDNVSIIGIYCFKNCSKLSELSLPASLTNVREAAFYGTALTNVTIPSKVQTIGAYAFKNCTVLKKVQLPNKLQKIDDSAFYGCTKMEMLELPDSVTSISNYAFRKCSGLQTIKFSNQLKTIGESAFYGCSGLTELNLPDTISSIEGYAFKGCTKVNKVHLPSSINTLTESVFYGCTGIASIEIPKNVKVIENYAFSSCSGLKEITFTGTMPEIGAYAFARVNAQVSYPIGDATWSKDKLQNYGGQLNWIIPQEEESEDASAIVSVEPEIKQPEAEESEETENKKEEVLPEEKTENSKEEKNSESEITEEKPEEKASEISDNINEKEEKTEEQQEKTKTEEIKENTLEEQQKEITNSKE